MADQSIGRSLMRGLRRRCPRCGLGALFSGHLRPMDKCETCGLDLSAYQSADFAPYFVMFLVGLLVTPLVVVGAVTHHDGVVWASGAFGAILAIILLPCAKGAGVGLMWATGAGGGTGLAGSSPATDDDAPGD